jgi:integrase
MARATSRKQWSYSTGERGRNRVRAFEHAKGVLMIEYAERGRRTRISLGHRDREQAKREADEAAAGLARAERPKSEGLSLAALFDNYLGEVTPRKTEGVRKFDHAAAERFIAVLGASRAPSILSRREWDLFIRERESGRCTGRRVGPRAVARDLKFLLAVLNWATMVSNGRDGVLLDRNPLKGLPVPSEKSPKRPALSESEYQALLNVADRVGPVVRTLLVLAHETGHRIGAIRKLRWSDLDMDARRIRWRAENDKCGLGHLTPMTGDVVKALDSHRMQFPGIGDAWIFPAPTKSSEPSSRHLVRDWWERAEALAGLERVERRGWHSLRRKFATELREAPLRDLCDLGGWKDPDTVVRCYQGSTDAQLRGALERRKRA